MANLCDSFLYPAVRLNKFNYSIIQMRLCQNADTPSFSYFIVLVYSLFSMPRFF